MTKELFVSSTPHETKVGLVEDDLLAEIYLERENEYTLAGSIYKGRVTRVLPGMQSAFVDFGLERDAFLYVSDFMELEEHDDDLTEAIPANRGVQDMRPQPARGEVANAPDSAETAGDEIQVNADAEEGSIEADRLDEGRPQTSATKAPEPSNGGESQNRERGGWRGRRRRRDGRRDGRDRGFDRGADRPQEQRFSRPVENRAPAGPPPGYEPILLPGESISKYRRQAQQPAVQEVRVSEIEATSGPFGQDVVPLAQVFPEDEPIFAADQALAEPLHEQHEETFAAPEEPAEAASTSTSWNRDFRHPEESPAPAATGWATEAAAPSEKEQVIEE